MNTKEYLEKVAYITEIEIVPGELSKVYQSKFDDSYITHVGMEDGVSYLAEREITEELRHGVGFSPKDNKWYGWSHRAIYGFTIGSTCNKGHCHYTAATPEEMIDDHANFFLDISQASSDQKRAECQILDDRSGIRILHTPISLPVVDDINNIADSLDDIDSVPEQVIFEDAWSVQLCGRGEWVAKTMEDAKEMAEAFNEGVS